MNCLQNGILAITLDEKVIDDIRAYQAIGVRTFVFDSPVPDPKVMVETMSRFAREVRPKVARLPRRGGGAAP